VVGTSSVDSGFALSRVAPEGTYAITRIAPPADRGVPLLEMQLSAAGDEVLLSDTRAPFTTLRLGPDGELRGRLEPGTPPGNGPGARWFPLPVVALDTGYVQVIADLASDARELVVFGADGRLLRTTRIELPLAFVSTVPGRRVLLGSRALGVREVVEYRWEWESDGKP
jgi:hypothetical protein